MDLKLYEEITGKEAVIKLIEGMTIEDGLGAKWYKEGETIKCQSVNGDVYDSVIPVVAFTREQNTWYVKKPFDVRAEMLARPNEWVGAFESASGDWYKVGFDVNEMVAVETKVFSKTTSPHTFKVAWDGNDVNAVGHADLFNICIPIEDVPVEELK